MKTVRLKENKVQEIIPDYALPVEKWYGKAFAAECVEAPDEVEQGWIYDPATGSFSEPVPVTDQEAEPTEEDDTAAMLVDHEYRLLLLELGLME